MPERKYDGRHAMPADTLDLTWAVAREVTMLVVNLMEAATQEGYPADLSTLEVRGEFMPLASGKPGALVLTAHARGVASESGRSSQVLGRSEKAVSRG